MSNQSARQARDRDELRAADSSWRSNSTAASSASVSRSGAGLNEFAPDDPSTTGSGEQSTESESRARARPRGAPAPTRPGAGPASTGSASPAGSGPSRSATLGDRFTVIGANENFRKWISWNEFVSMLRTGEARFDSIRFDSFAALQYCTLYSTVTCSILTV